MRVSWSLYSLIIFHIMSSFLLLDIKIVISLSFFFFAKENVVVFNMFLQMLSYT